MTFARRKAGWGSLRLFFLNPPHPSLTVREGVRGLAALWAPANWRNVGWNEALLLALPFGDTLYFGVWNAFPPSGTSYFWLTRVTWRGWWRHYCFRRTWGLAGKESASRPFGARLYCGAPAE